LINPIRNLCSRNDELKRYLHLEGIALHALGDAGVDAGSLPLDTPLSALGEFTGVQGHARWAAEASGSAEPTIRDLAFVLEGANRVVGTADEIACYLEEWREAGVNGINIYHATSPGSFREVADRLFPTLRERGLIATDKSGDAASRAAWPRRPAAAYTRRPLATGEAESAPTDRRGSRPDGQGTTRDSDECRVRGREARCCSRRTRPRRSETTRAS
jgi:hypothetical protein